MGDYLNNGNKIGTCGRAYYATKEALESHRGEPEADYYLNPENGCSFAFPFPEYDGKAVGEISNFHDGRTNFVISLPAEKFKTFHGRITHHLHPQGLGGFNVFIDCPYNGGEVSNNFDKENVKFYLREQIYYNGELRILAECVCCGERNILDEAEAVHVCREIEKQYNALSDKEKNARNDEERLEICKQINYLLKIGNRILETYDQKEGAK